MDYQEQEPESQDPQIESTDEITEVPLEDTVEAKTAGLAPETVELMDLLDEEAQTECAQKVYDNYERDLKSGTKWRDRHAQILRLALGDIPPPEDGDFAKARIHYAIIMKAAIRLQARIYDQQFPSNGEFFGVKPTDALDLARSVRVAKYLNWQVLHKIPEYVPNHDALIMQWLLYGSAFTYVYWDPITNRPCHEILNTEDVILPYFVRKGKVEPSLADLPRITRILRKYRHELEEMADNGYYKNVDKLYDEETEKQEQDSVSRGEMKTGQVQEVVDKDAGVTKQGDGVPGSRELIEQHCWYKLPNEKRQRPVIITIDKLTKIMLSLKVRYDEDPDDRARYNREKEAAEAAYQAAMQKFQMDVAAYESGMTEPPMMTPPPMPGEQTATMPPMPGAATSTLPGMPPVGLPQPPMPPADPPQPKMIPIHFFTHYVCIPNPEGIYGLGIGSLLEGANIAADVMASQVVDAATLANTVTGVKSREAKIRGGELQVKPGEIVDCDLMPNELDKAFHFFTFKGPDPAMGQLIKDQKEEGDELSGAGEIMSGEVGGSNETATTTQIRIGQAMQAVGILNKRYSRARTCEGQKIARLDSVYLADSEYFPVVDPFKLVPTDPGEVGTDENGQPMVPGLKKEQIGRRDFLEDTDITVTADPRMASQPQRFQEAAQAFNMFSQIPIFVSNPTFMAALAKNLLVAMDRPELVRALETPPPMPMGPPGAPPGGPPGPPQPSNGPPPGKPGGRPQPSPPLTVPNGGNQPANNQATA